MMSAALAASLALGMALIADVTAGEVAVPNPPVTDTLEGHIGAATKAAGLDLWGILTLCLPGGGVPPESFTDDGAPPMKVFDNLYYLGMKGVAAWAVTTSQGIILIDTLNNQREAETFIEGGLRQLGLDPTQIKYIVITHGHADHHGGAQYLADKFNAEMVMSEADWAFLEGPQAPQAQPDRGPIPKRGRAVKDGDRLMLGDTTIELYVTPPHTPGTLSLIFPLKDGAMSHVGGLWGGTGFVFEPNLENFTTYAASADRFARTEAESGVDVVLSNHPIFDDALIKMEALKARRAQQPHPFVTGPMTVARYMTVASQCAQARARALVEPRPSDPSGLLK